MARSMKIQVLLFVLLLVLGGCSGNHRVPAALNNPVTLTVSVNQTANAGIEQPLETTVSTDSEYDVSNLGFILPKGWNLSTGDRFYASLTDENGMNLGSIITYPYAEDFDFKFYKPNHSEITNEELIDTPIGSGKLYTLDADNGTAASGLTGTHDVYFAVIPIQDKIINVLEFSKHDKEAASKKQFVGLLSGLRLKNERQPIEKR
ncbi:hypothetical protein ACP26L_15820 [Paenibacillus sp. S-38]|uniref:hypothetical protein n=1 Tax=Paenibacillus sp. S-38 TaxID=3416710 RepID=UPI003CF6272D